MQLITLANNQTIISDTMENTTKISFFSYDSLIAEYIMKNDDLPKLNLIGDIWDFSNTTRKYFAKYVNEYTCFTYKDKKNFLKLIENEPQINVIEN